MRYPCGACDYAFTLALGFCSCGGFWYFYPDTPWWFYVAAAHSITAKWFLETRP